MIISRLWQMCEALDASAKPEQQQLQVGKSQRQCLVAHGSCEAGPSGFPTQNLWHLDFLIFCPPAFL